MNRRGDKSTGPPLRVVWAYIGGVVQTIFMCNSYYVSAFGVWLIIAFGDYLFFDRTGGDSE